MEVYFNSMWATPKEPIVLDIKNMTGKAIILEAVACPFSEANMSDAEASEITSKRSALALIHINLYYAKMVVWIWSDIAIPVGQGLKIAYDIATQAKGDVGMVNIVGKTSKKLDIFHNFDLTDVGSYSRQRGLVFKDESEIAANEALGHYIAKIWTEEYRKKLYTKNKELIEALIDVYLYGQIVLDPKLNKIYREKTMRLYPTNMPAKAILERKWSFPAPEVNHIEQMPKFIDSEIDMLEKKYKIVIK